MVMFPVTVPQALNRLFKLDHVIYLLGIIDSMAEMYAHI
jgi:hypothetical protein